MNRLRILTMIALICAAPGTSAACRWFGTQLECDFPTGRVMVGTQAAAEPTYGTSIPIHAFGAGRGLPGERAASRHALDIQVQDVGADPSLCRTIGNETYCY